MIMSAFKIHLAAAVAAAVCSTAAVPAGAYEIYKWVDENGVVHYSESAPEQTDADVKTLELELTNPPGYDPADDYYSIENQAERIRAQWEAIAEEKAEREEAERAAAVEERLARLESRSIQAHAPTYRPAANVFLPLGHQRLFRPHPARRPHGLHERQRPRAERSAPGRGTRPGWPGHAAGQSARPGFASPED